MQFVHNVYERKIGKGKIDEDMWGEYVRIYRDAVSKGYGMSHNTSFDRSSRMADQIEHNIEVFSAFKTHNQQELMAQKMMKDGKRVGFDEFKAAVEPIARHHNGAWLQTEYATASLRAAQAADWQEFEQNADIFPNLKWMPTTSARPDEAVHGTYSGLTGPQVILPIRDPFWDNHRPGDRWNCKCGLEPTDEPSLHQTNKQAAARAEQGKPTGQRGLQANPGKKGEVFDTKHPYFPKNCKQCPFFSVSTGVKNASTTPHCQDCNKPPKAEKKTKELKGITLLLDNLHHQRGSERIDTLRKITNDASFKPYINSKGKVERGIFRTADANDPDLENLLISGRKLVAKGYNVFILPNPTKTKSGDFILTRKSFIADFDLKTISGKNSIGDRLEGSVGQTNRVLLRFEQSQNFRQVAIDIQNYFEYNKDAVEVWILKGEEIVRINKHDAESKKFMQIFFSKMR